MHEAGLVIPSVEGLSQACTHTHTHSAWSAVSTHEYVLGTLRIRTVAQAATSPEAGREGAIE